MGIEAVSINDTPEQALEKINRHDNAGGLGDPVGTSGIADAAVTAEKIAAGAVGTEKIADAAISTEKLNATLAELISQSGAGGANAPGYYERDTAFTATEKTVITTPARMWINIAKKGYIIEAASTLDISQDDVWDTKAKLWEAKHAYQLNDVVYPSATKTGYYYRCTTAGTSSSLTPTFPTTIGGTYNDGDCVWICEYDFTVPANRKGHDFYIYSCAPTTGTTPAIMISENSTVALRYTPDTSRKTGGFHCLCADVGTNVSDHNNTHPLSGYVAGDILPASVWDLIHRPVSEPEGMVYIDGLDIWVDIYLSSWTGSYSNSPEDLKLVSKYGALTADGTSAEKFHCWKFEQVFGRQKKRLLFQREFMVASIGSNQGTNVKGGADVNTTGGFIDTAGRRMISNYGIEDCCGNLWQWGADVGCATTGSSSYGNGYDANDKYVGGQVYGAVYRPVYGGDASSALTCGSRGSFWNNSALYLYWNLGGRGASGPLYPKAA